MKKLNTALLITFLGLSTATFANTGTITINGKIYNETCVLSGASTGTTGTGSIIVTLDTIPSSSFTDVARIKGEKNFELKLSKADGTDCYTVALATKLNPVVTLSTSGSNYDPNDSTLLINKAGTASTANPVYVQILAKETSTATGKAVNFSSTTQERAAYILAENKFYYTAQYNAGTKTLPAAQDVSAEVTYNITYP